MSYHNNQFSIYSKFLAVFFIAVLSISCTSSPKYDISMPEITISQASEKELKKFGSNFYENPYLEPSTLLGGKKYEFFIVRIDLNIREATDIEIEAQAEVPQGAAAPRALARNQLIEFWELLSDESVRVNQYQKKKTTIELTTCPDFRFRAKEGRKTYYLVFIGKYPIKKPVSYSIKIYSSNGQIITFDHTVE